MLTSSQIIRYGIIGAWDSFSSIDELFSGRINDPVITADENAAQIGAVFWDVVIAICGEGKCIAQVIMFRSKEGYELYKKDKVVIFNQSEL